MNTRTTLFIAAIVSIITVDLYGAEAMSAQKPKKSRRAVLREQRKEQLARPSAPAKRFDDGTSRGSLHRTYQYMGYAELEEGKQKLITERNYDTAIEYIKQQMYVATDTEAHHIPDLLLEMADLLYAKQDYDKAWKAYAQWALQYPGASKKIVVEAEKASRAIAIEVATAADMLADLATCTQIEHARFRAVDAAFRCTEELDRDQTQTHTTVELADEFLKQRDRFITHRTAVEKIRTACYEKLIDSELNVCTFYRLQGNTQAVSTRLALIEEEYSVHYPTSKTRVLAYRATHYPDTVDMGDANTQKAILLAQTEPKKPHAADRF